MALSFSDAVMWATSLSDTRQFRHTGRDDLHHGRVEGAELPTPMPRAACGTFFRGHSRTLSATSPLRYLTTVYPESTEGHGWTA